MRRGLLNWGQVGPGRGLRLGGMQDFFHGATQESKVLEPGPGTGGYNGWGLNMKGRTGRKAGWGLC